MAHPGRGRSGPAEHAVRAASDTAAEAPHGTRRPASPARPELSPTREDLADRLAPARREGRTIALIPTMGALHEGHASLLRAARDRAGAAGVVVASVFVNPLQFGAGEDLDRYPRTLEADLDVCAEESVDVVFAPAVEEVYPGGDPVVTVEPGPLAGVLEGATRPGHFAGVLTVVAKLFGLVRPDVAVFGEKDYQQLVLIRRMVTDLCLGVEVVGVPTARDADGLALSSRNQFLTGEQRQRAGALHRTLRAAARGARHGVEPALEHARAELGGAQGIDLDYLALTDAELGELSATAGSAAPVTGRALIAARVGSTRLIDNLGLVLGDPGPGHAAEPRPEPRPQQTPPPATHPTIEPGER